MASILIISTGKCYVLLELSSALFVKCPYTVALGTQIRSALLIGLWMKELKIFVIILKCSRIALDVFVG